jgi:transcriptional regulator of acetoin/glycerol metabolism
MTNTHVLFPEDFPTELQKARSGNKVESEGKEALANATSLEDLEKAHITKVLQDVQFNKSKASEVLGIDRATLYRKAQRYGIDLRGK